MDFNFGAAIASFLVVTAVVYIAPRILKGVEVDGMRTAALAALLMGVINFFLGWLIVGAVEFFFATIDFLTFGLGHFLFFFTSFVANLLLVAIVQWLMKGFNVKDGWSLVLLTLLIAAGHAIVYALALMMLA